MRQLKTRAQVLDVVIAEPVPSTSPLIQGVFNGITQPHYMLEGSHLIEVLDPGIPDPATTPPKKQEGVFPDLRKSEARYIPMRLKETLETTGYWGAVRVVPAGTSSVDLAIFGEIGIVAGRYPDGVQNRQLFLNVLHWLSGLLD